MSVSKWAYEPSKCDGDYCCGDCDFCSKADIFEDDDYDDEFEEERFENVGE